MAAVLLLDDWGPGWMIGAVVAAVCALLFLGFSLPVSRRWLVSAMRRLVAWIASVRLQLVLFLAGSALALDAVLTRPRPEMFPVYELVSGLAVVLLAVVLPRLRKVKGGPFELELGGDALEVALETAEEMQTGRPVVDEDEVIGVARQVAGYQAIQRLLAPGGLGTEWIGADVDFRLFTYDQDVDRLMPVVEPGEAVHPSRGWTPGQGVTGAAFATGRFHLAVGDATHDSTHGLTEDQQNRYEDLVAVAATPVFNATRRVIAVVSASSREESTNLADEEETRDLLLFLSVLCARVLVDLLRWFDDE